MILTIKQAEQFAKQAEQCFKRLIYLKQIETYEINDVAKHLNRILVREGFYSIQTDEGVSVMNSDESLTVIKNHNGNWNAERRIK